MRIIVSGENAKGIHLCIPTGLVLNRFTALFVPGITKKHGAPITYRQCVAFIKELKRCKKRYADWTLVEVTGAKGETVFVKL